MPPMWCFVQSLPHSPNHNHHHHHHRWLSLAWLGAIEWISKMGPKFGRTWSWRTTKPKNGWTGEKGEEEKKRKEKRSERKKKELKAFLLLLLFSLSLFLFYLSGWLNLLAWHLSECVVEMLDACLQSDVSFSYQTLHLFVRSFFCWKILEKRKNIQCNSIYFFVQFQEPASQLSIHPCNQSAQPVSLVTIWSREWANELVRGEGKERGKAN